MSSAQIDTFLAPFPDPDKTGLQQLRARLLALLPGAQEVLSYGIPGLRYGGMMVAGYTATNNHLSFYPHSAAVFPSMARRLAALGLSHSKSALHFYVTTPIPDDLLRDILTARLEEAGIAKPETLA